MHPLAVNLLGGIALSVNAQPLPSFPTTKSGALLAYLAVESARPHSRKVLARLLWPRVPGRQAGNNLRNTLHRVRQTLDAVAPGTSDQVLTVNRQSIQFDATHARVDVLEFQARVLAAATHKHRSLITCETCLTQLQEAADLYKGELLFGLNLPDSRAFEEWLLLRREYLHQQVLQVLSDLATALEHGERFQQAQAIALRLVGMDPYREATHRQMMRLLARQDMPERALAQFEGLRRLLQEDLGVEPDEATTTLVGQIAARSMDRGLSAVSKTPVHPVPRLDWSEAPLVGPFFGRASEIDRLQQWLVQDRCQLITLLGMGGIGKSTLAAYTARRMSSHFDTVVWRSLINAPPLDQLLGSVIQTLSNWPLDGLPESLESALSELMERLRLQRCLLVLDNVETIMQAEEAGRFRPGYEAYEQLLHRVGHFEHQSCLLLTSRERPVGMKQWEGENGRIRSLELAGLDEQAAEEMLRERGLSVPAKAVTALIHRYSGNPLALHLVAQTIQDFPTGDVEAALSDETPIFDDIREVLDEQINRLTPLERDILVWLASTREPTTPSILRQDLVRSPSQGDLLDTIRRLQRRSLVEKRASGFGLQNVLTEYLADRLVAQVISEVENTQIDYLDRFALMQAQAGDMVRESQARLILEPIARQLKTTRAIDAAGDLFGRLLAALHAREVPVPGYAAGNILNLMLHMDIDVAGCDFSGLTLWQACLQGRQVPQVDFSGADLARCAFTDTFDVITSVAYSPDGRLLAAGGADGKIRLWRTAGGALDSILEGHENVVLTIAFSPDSRSLASGGVDGTVRLWDVGLPAPARFGQALTVLREHVGRIFAVAFSPDGRTLASGGQDRTIRLWDVDERTAAVGAVRANLEGHTDQILALAFSPDGRTLASGSGDHTIRLWDLADTVGLEAGQATAILKEHEGPVNSVAFDPIGKVLVSAGADGAVRLWDAENGHCHHVLRGHRSWVTTVAVSPDGRTVASAGIDHAIQVWNVADRRVLAGERPPHTLWNHTDWIRTVAFSPDGRVLASAGDDKTVQQWDTRTWQRLRTYRGFKNRVLSIAFHPDGHLLAGAGEDGVPRLWPVGAAGREAISLRPREGARPGGRTMAIAFHPDGGILASGGWETPVQFWDLQTGRLLVTFAGHGRWVGSIAFSPDGRFVATGGEDQAIHLWRLTKRGTVDTDAGPRILKGHSQAVLTLAFSPDSNTLASGSADGTACLWDVVSGRARQRLEGHTNWLNSVAFGPAGNLLASGSADTTILLWDLPLGQPRQKLLGHHAWVRSVSFSPDGQTLASGANDFTVRIWDIERGQARHVLREHQDMVWSVAFSPDGQSLASGSGDETIKLWDPGTGVCTATWRLPGPYQGMTITGATGISAAQRQALRALGAVDLSVPAPSSRRA